MKPRTLFILGAILFVLNFAFSLFMNTLGCGMASSGNGCDPLKNMFGIIWDSPQYAPVFMALLVISTAMMSRALFSMEPHGGADKDEDTAAGDQPAPHRSPRRTAAMALAAFAVVAAIWGFWPQRGPSSIRVVLDSHTLSPSMKRLTIRNRVAGSSIRSIQTDGAHYAHRLTDRVDFEVLWYDILEKRAWRASFPVWARELTAASGDRRDASMRIAVGPGPDVTIRNSSGWQAPVLRQICATPFPVSDPHVQDWIARVIPNDYTQYYLKEYIESRERYLAKGNIDTPHCPAAGEDQ